MAMGKELVEDNETQTFLAGKSKFSGYKINWIKNVGLNIVTLTFFFLIMLLLLIITDVPYQNQWVVDRIFDFGWILIMVGNTLISIEKRTPAKTS
jgi:hypothetical protein